MHPLTQSLGIRWEFGRLASTVPTWPCGRLLLRPFHPPSCLPNSLCDVPWKQSTRSRTDHPDSWPGLAMAPWRQAPLVAGRWPAISNGPASPSLPGQQFRQGCRELGQRQPRTGAATVRFAVSLDCRLQESPQQLRELPPAAVIHWLEAVGEQALVARLDPIHQFRAPLPPLQPGGVAEIREQVVAIGQADLQCFPALR